MDAWESVVQRRRRKSDGRKREEGGATAGQARESCRYKVQPDSSSEMRDLIR